MKKTLENQVLALAAVVNCAELVADIATEGSCDRVQRAVMLESIFSIESDSLDTVYGSRDNLLPGLQRIVDQFKPNRDVRVHAAQYQVSLIQLQYQLMKRAEARSALRRGIEQLAEFREMRGGELDDTVVNRLSTLYQDTLSTLKPRIIIRGHAAHLAAQDKADTVRALLMAGVRAAVLWRQAGGSRWSLLLGRRASIQTAQHLIDTLSSEPRQLH
ncbi:MAG: high frequency lysogenization protein HflD [Pseudomonadota bacterium]